MLLIISLRCSLFERMKQNLSVFHSGVSTPASMLPLSVIPDIYRQC